MCQGSRCKAVAVVDSNAITRALLKIKLARNGALVTAFESGTDFLRSPRSQWDLVVVRAFISDLPASYQCVSRSTTRSAHRANSAR